MTAPVLDLLRLLAASVVGVDGSVAGVLLAGVLLAGAAIVVAALALVASRAVPVPALAAPRADVDLPRLLRQSHPDADGHRRSRAPGATA